MFWSQNLRYLSSMLCSILFRSFLFGKERSRSSVVACFSDGVLKNRQNPVCRTKFPSSPRTTTNCASVDPTRNAGGSFISGVKSASLMFNGVLQSHVGVSIVDLESANWPIRVSNSTSAHHSLRRISASNTVHLARVDSLWIPIRCAMRMATPSMDDSDWGIVLDLTEI